MYDGYPYSVWKIEEKKVPLISSFRTCATFEAGDAADREKKNVSPPPPPPMVRFGFPPMYISTCPIARGK